jgi:transposase
MGFTPIQNRSGGEVKPGTIGKSYKKSMLRSQVIDGAMAVVNQLVKETPKQKMLLKALVERRVHTTKKSTSEDKNQLV